MVHPSFYWSMIMPRAYCVPIHPNEIFQARTPRITSNHGIRSLTHMVRWDARINAPTRHAQPPQRTTTSTSNPTCMGRRRSYSATSPRTREIWSQRAKHHRGARSHRIRSCGVAVMESGIVDTSILVELYYEVEEMLLKNGLCYRPSLYTLA